MPSTSAILRAAKALLAQPNGWTQRAYARNGRGRPASVYAGDTVSFCPLGALMRAADGKLPPQRKAQLALCEIVGPVALGKWNDAPERTQAEVLATFDRAIDFAEQRFA